MYWVVNDGECGHKKLHTNLSSSNRSNKKYHVQFYT